MQSKGILLCIACFLCISGVYAQELPFIHYTPKDGLVNSRIVKAYQDSKGRMYFLTYGGLSVYDGARFSNYTAAEGLADNLVNDILEVGDDSLLVATNTGQLNVLVKGKMKSFATTNKFCPLINRFLKSPDGKLYAVCDEGLYLLERHTFTRLPTLNTSGAETGTYLGNGIFYKNFLLLFPWSPQGHANVLVYDLLRKKITDIQSFSVFQAIEKNPGELWLATENGPRRLDNASLDTGKLALLPASPQYNLSGKFIPHFILFDSYGRTWFAGTNDILKLEAGGEQHYYGKNQGFGTGNISGLFVDREGIAWILSDGTGLFKLVNTNVEIINRYANDAHDIIAGAIANNQYSDSTWFFSVASNTFYETDPHTRRLHYLPGKPISLFFLSGGPSLYFCRDNAVYKVSNKNNPGDYLHPQLVFRDPLNVTYIHTGLPDPFGNLVLSVNGNANNYDLLAISPEKKVAHYPLRYLVDHIAFDKNNRLWVAGRGGELKVFRLHPDNPDRYFELLHDYSKQIPATVSPRSISIDTNNNVWLGTRQDGILQFAMENGQLKSARQFTQKNGLTDDFILHLACDRYNNIWSCSAQGLDKIMFNKGQYIIENVTKSKNIFFQTSYAVTDAAGTAWALASTGSIIKVVRANPGKSIVAPSLLLTGILVNNTPFDHFLQPAVFSHNNNNLNFSVAAPSFIDEKQIAYSYMLEGGSNTGWSLPLPVNNFNLLNLSPGKYRLHVRADFPAAVYPPQLLVYPFTIQPAWWQTWWFRVLVIVAIIVIALALTRYYVKTRLERQRVAMEKKQIIEQERTRIATDLHDDLGAGLSSIRFISEKAKRNSTNEMAQNNIDQIVTASTELIDKMNEIIWAMNEKNDSLEDLLYYTRSYAMEYCGDHHLECSISLPDQIPAIAVSGEIRRNIFLTIKESMHNIVKHAEANKVTILIELTRDLSIHIQDDGKGMDSFAGDKNEGNGLKNMQKRMESIGGTMTILNSRGVRVEITAPIAL